MIENHKKASFKALSGPSKDQSFDVHFNPASLEYQIANRVNQGQTTSTQYVNSTHATLAMELHFDTSHNGEDVRLHTSKIAAFLRPIQQGQKNARQVPPQVQFSWGVMNFTGVVEQFRETLDFFSASGVPLRSRINITLSSQKTLFAPEASQSGQSPAESVQVPGAQSTTGVATSAGDPNAGRLLALANALDSMRFPDGPISVSSDIQLGPPAAFVSAGAAIGASAALGASAGISAGIGIGAGASFGASAGISAGASAGFSGGAGAGFSAGASGGVGASAGASAGFSGGAGASFGATASAGFSAGASGGVGASAGASAGFSAGASAGLGASAGAAFKASAGGSSAAAAYFTPTFGSSASAYVPATFGAFAGLHTQAQPKTVQLNTSGLLQTKTESYTYSSSATFNIAGQVDVRASGSADAQLSASAQSRIRFQGG